MAGLASHLAAGAAAALALAHVGLSGGAGGERAAARIGDPADLVRSIVERATARISDPGAVPPIVERAHKADRLVPTTTPREPAAAAAELAARPASGATAPEAGAPDAPQSTRPAGRGAAPRPAIGCELLFSPLTGRPATLGRCAT